MTIQNAYDGENGNIFIRDESGQVISVPNDPANAHYQEYLAWVGAGNEPEPKPADL